VFAIAGQHTFSAQIDFRFKNGKAQAKFEQVRYKPSHYENSNPFSGLFEHGNSVDDQTKILNECVQPIAAEMFRVIREEANDGF
jgi:hypothetical protein